MNQLLKVVRLVQCVLILVEDVNQSAMKTFQQTLQIKTVQCSMLHHRRGCRPLMWVRALPALYGSYDYDHSRNRIRIIRHVTTLYLTVSKHPKMHINSIYSLQCCNAANWVTGRATSL